MGELVEITYDDLVQALEDQYQENPEGYLTTQEISHRMHHSIKWVTYKLRELKAEGRLEMAMVKRESLSGVMLPTPAYRIKKA